MLLYKIALVLKRSEGNIITDTQLFEIGKYAFDHKLREIRLGTEKQLVSPKESSLLKLLCEHKNDLLPREIALKRIWGNEGYFTTRSRMSS